MLQDCDAHCQLRRCVVTAGVVSPALALYERQLSPFVRTCTRGRHSAPNVCRHSTTIRAAAPPSLVTAGSSFSHPARSPGRERRVVAAAA